MSRVRLIALLAFLLCLIASPAAAQGTWDPTWVATPPVGIVNQPVGLLFANTTADSVFINSTVWQVHDGDGNLVAEFSFRPAAFWAVPPGGVIPGGFLPEYADTFTATVWWYTPSLSGPGVYDIHSESVQVPVFGGGVVWNVVPDPVFQRTASNYSQVTLNLTNGSPKTVWLRSTNPWEITDGAGNHVYSPWTSPAYTPVLSGQTKSWPWALVYEDSSAGAQYVPPGDYVANIDIFNGSGDTSGVRLRDRFTVKPRPSGSVIWRATPVVQSTKSVMLLSLTNATSDSICASNLIPWTIKDSSGNPVFEPLRLWAVLKLGPGESRSWVWDERDNSGNWVAAGSYMAELPYYKCPSGSVTTLVSDFMLVDPPPPSVLCDFLVPDSYIVPTTAPVGFTFTNCVPDSIVMPWFHGWWVTNAAGLPVYSPIVLMVHTPMAAYASFRDSWDQRDARGVYVPPGGYYFWSGFWDKYCATAYTVRSRLPVVIRGTTSAPGDGLVQLPLLRVGSNPALGAVDLEVTAGAGAEGPVIVSILSITGRVVFETRYEPAMAGPRRISWRGQASDGTPASSGLYFIRVLAGERAVTQKVVFLR